ncbi:MAG: NAD(P)H-binding protein [Bacteroidota bacterium]
MKIIVFGATGMVGKEIVKQALYNGNTVKAFGRNVFTEGLPDNDKLELVQGALFDEGEVYKAIKGCDAVVLAIGGAFDGTDKTRSLGMKNIVKQMEKANVKRIVALGGMGVLDATDGKLMMEQEDFPAEHFALSQEHQKALGFLQSSKLDWTFVCPPMIEEAAPSGIFATAANELPQPNHFTIGSGDLALFMLKEITANQFVKQRVGISS